MAKALIIIFPDNIDDPLGEMVDTNSRGIFYSDFIFSVTSLLTAEGLANRFKKVLEIQTDLSFTIPRNRSDI